MITTTDISNRGQRLLKAYEGTVKWITEGSGQGQSLIEELKLNDAQSSYAVNAKEMIGRYKAHGLLV